MEGCRGGFDRARAAGGSRARKGGGRGAGPGQGDKRAGAGGAGGRGTPSQEGAGGTVHGNLSVCAYLLAKSAILRTLSTSRSMGNVAAHAQWPRSIPLSSSLAQSKSRGVAVDLRGKPSGARSGAKSGARRAPSAVEDLDGGKLRGDARTTTGAKKSGARRAPPSTSEAAEILSGGGGKKKFGGPGG